MKRFLIYAVIIWITCTTTISVYFFCTIFESVEKPSQEGLKAQAALKLSQASEEVVSQSIKVPLTFTTRVNDVTKRSVALQSTEVNLPANRGAVVFVDTWNIHDDMEQLPSALQKQVALRAFAREKGMVVIFAPNEPVVSKYDQYQQLRDEIAQHDWQMPVQDEAFHLSNKSLRNQLEQARTEAQQLTPLPNHWHTRDISKHFLPVYDNEYMLKTYDELLYVFQKHQIEIVFYVGASMIECLQQRPTGINRLIGSDDTRLPQQVVLVKDAISARDMIGFSEDEVIDLFYQYFLLKIAWGTTTKALFEANAFQAPKIQQSDQ